MIGNSLLYALACTIWWVPRADSQNWDLRTPMNPLSTFRINWLLPNSKALARCVKLFKAKSKLQGFKIFVWSCGRGILEPSFNVPGSLMIWYPQDNGHTSPYHIGIAQLCLTLLVGPPSSVRNNLDEEILGPKMKRRVGGSRGGLSVWIIVLAFLGGSFVFGLFFWLVLKCYRVLLATWG